MSREIDLDDWGVSQDFFNEIDRIWGPFTVDLFAVNSNIKLSRFNSKFWCAGTSQVDGFAVSWQMEFNWLVPPISLISDVIKHVRASRAMATLIAPAWPSAFFLAPVVF